MKKYLVKSSFVLLVSFFTIRSAAQQPYTVTLRVDNNQEAKLYHDEPAIFAVSVTNKVAQENRRWNMAADRRLGELEQLIADKKISREDYDKEKKKLNDGKKPISSVTIGSKGTPWASLIVWKAVNKKSGTEIILPVMPLTNPLSEEVAVLGANGNYITWFGIDPDGMKKVTAGEYSVTATINGESSDAVQLNVLQENMSVTMTESEFGLMKMGQFYWHSNDSKKAMQYAEKLLQKNPSSLDALSLKGDIQILDRSYLPALETYNKAVKEYYKQNPGVSEVPEYLLEMIAWIKTQI